MSTHVVNIGSYTPLAMPPNMPRVGVIGGLALNPADWSITALPNSPQLIATVTGLAVTVTGGIAVVGPSSGTQWLCVYQPAGYGAVSGALNPIVGTGNFAAAPPNAPANAAIAYLWMTVTSLGVFSWYWNTSSTVPTNAGDALIGWVSTNATAIVQWSANIVWAATLGEGTMGSLLEAPAPPLAGGQGPGGAAYGDTGTPGAAPQIGAETFLPGDGTIVFGGSAVGWDGAPTNIASVSSLTVQIYYVLEAGAQTGPALTAAVTASAVTFDVTSSAGMNGNLYAIDQELVLVTAAPTGTTITVARGQAGTLAMAHAGPTTITGATNAAPIVITAAGHGRINGQTVTVTGVGGNTAANQNWQASAVTTNTMALWNSTGNAAYTSGGTVGGAVLYPVQVATQVFPLSPQFFTSVAAANFTWPVALPNANIIATASWATNAFGQSPVFTAPLGEAIAAGGYPATLTTPYGGFRTLTAGAVTFQVNGTLGIASNAAPPVYSGGASGGAFAFGSVSAYVLTAPSGAAITLQLTLNGANWCTLTIANGATVALPQSGLALGAVPAGALVALNVIGVGTTFPGAGLTVVLQ